MYIVPLKSKLLIPGSNTLDALDDSLKRSSITLQHGDVVAVASKAVAVGQNRVVDLATVKVGSKARRLAKRYGMEPTMVQVVIDESDKLLGGIHGVMVTLKGGMLVANAGVDRSNISAGSVALWPADPFGWAEDSSKRLSAKYGCHVSVIVVDSRVHPLRAGTEGAAIGFAGFEGVRDYRGVPDLYGKPLKITRLALADELSCAAHLIMGEAAESIPFVLIRDAPITPADSVDRSSVLIPPEECLFMGSIFRHASRTPKSRKARTDRVQSE